MPSYRTSFVARRMERPSVSMAGSAPEPTANSEGTNKNTKREIVSRKENGGAVQALKDASVGVNQSEQSVQVARGRNDDMFENAYSSAFESAVTSAAFESAFSSKFESAFNAKFQSKFDSKLASKLESKLESRFSSAEFESAFNAEFESKLESAFNRKIEETYQEEEDKVDPEGKHLSGQDSGEKYITDRAIVQLPDRTDTKFESKFEPMFHTDLEDMEPSDQPKYPAEKYPSDCYSFIAEGPNKKNSLLPFFFGIAVFFFQYSLIGLMLFSKTYFMNSNWRSLSENEDVDNPDQEKEIFNGGNFIPANTSVVCRVTQVISVLAFFFIGGESLSDFTNGVIFFPLSKPCQHMWLKFACILKFSQGLLACITAVLLVVISTDVIDIVLNFAAINFISSFDDAAYYIAASGAYGKTLKDEVERLQRKDLPKCIFKNRYPKSYHVLYMMPVGILATLLMGVVALIIVNGERNDVWATQMLRVEFEGNIQHYSGCFEATNIEHHRRMTYESYKLANNVNATLAYCQEEHQWIFHQESPDANPCNLTNDDSILAKSTKTYSYDVSTAFDTPWFSQWNKPIAVSFTDNDKNNDTEDFFYCTSYQNDGICDEALNNFYYQYDGGDCCSATCSDPDQCGTNAVVFETIFGEDEITGLGFPSCKDPYISSKAAQIQIHLDQIPENDNQTSTDQIPNLELICLQKGRDYRVFSIPLFASMEGNSETVWLSGGAECNLQINVGNISFEETEGSDDNGDSDLSLDMIVEYHVIQVLEATLETGNAIVWNLVIHEGTTGTTGRNDTKEGFGIYHEDSSRLSTELDLLQYGTEVMGSIPPEIGDLTSLSSMDLRYNSATGSIPTEVGLLTLLNYIDLSSNRLNETIPSEIGQLTFLTHLNIAYNGLTGLIPTEIGLLTSVTSLDLSSNDFTAPIISEIGQMTSLKRISARYNEFDGSIPSEIGQLTSLTYLNFNMNLLDGPIPREMGQLTSLTALHFYQNKLTGSIPSEIGLLTSLTVLELDMNDLNGAIPSEIGLLTLLETIYLTGNKFNGLIPSEIGLLTSLNLLDIGNNEFTGPVPIEIKNLDIRSFDFDDCCGDHEQ